MIENRGRPGASRTAEAIHIREARPEEYGTILDVTRAAYEQYAADMPADRWDAYMQNMAETIMQDGSVLRIVAERDGHIAGSVLLFLAGGADREEPMIRLLAVAPEARGQGIGRALMEDCLRRGARVRRHDGDPPHDVYDGRRPAAIRAHGIRARAGIGLPPG